MFLWKVRSWFRRSGRSLRSCFFYELQVRPKLLGHRPHLEQCGSNTCSFPFLTSCIHELLPCLIFLSWWTANRFSFLRVIVLVPADNFFGLNYSAITFDSVPACAIGCFQLQLLKCIPASTLPTFGYHSTLLAFSFILFRFSKFINMAKNMIRM